MANAGEPAHLLPAHREAECDDADGPHQVEILQHEEPASEQEVASEQRQEALQSLKAQLQTPDEGEVDDKILERFLVTNEMDVKAALIPLVKFLKWRQSFAPLGYIPEEGIANERSKGKVCLQGHDKQGRTIGVFLAVRHDTFDRELEEFKRFAVYALEKAIASSRHELLELSIIVDLAGWGFRQVDIRGYLAALEILQEHYLKHLGKMILVHAPYIFWAAWKLTYPFFNESTKEKMMFVEDKDLKSMLLEEIDEDQIPDIYGGKLRLQPA